MKPSNALTASALALALAGCGGGEDTVQEYGTSPTLPEPTRGLLPSMNIAEPVPWGDQTPTVPSGYRVTAIATDLKIPRQTLVLPNGDILVAEGRGGSAPALQPKDVIAGVIKARGTTPVESGDRLIEMIHPGGQKVEEKWTENAGFWVEATGENERVYHCSHGMASPPDFDSLVYKVSIKSNPLPA